LSHDFLRPSAPAERIFEVDVVRGFALFGVLLVNMYGFGADSIAWNAPLDRLAYTITHFFFDSKSWTLFSMLFGFGFALQLSRAKVRGLPFLSTYLRRLGVLLVFGAAHTMLYDGDILILYAELGLGLLVLHRLATRWLLVLAVALLLIFPFGHLLTPDRDSEIGSPIETVAEARVSLDHKRQTHVYVQGSLGEVATYNASAIPATPYDEFNWADSGLAAFAMFLLGYVIGRSKIMSKIPEKKASIVRVRGWGLGIGLTAMAAELTLATNFGYAVYRPSSAPPMTILAGDLLFACGAVALALGYAATLVLAAQTRKGRTFLTPLAGVGRMALTVYLTQSLIFTSLFYGYGLGMAYQVGPAAVSVWAVGIFIGQVLACRWWLRRYRFGPAEWLWRCLTYLKWQPLRNAVNPRPPHH
jgi:uncharacterized protein